eukprot:7859761-Alexandrium_andersonii.AAC.1
MSASLVGSEMCIRDRPLADPPRLPKKERLELHSSALCKRGQAFSRCGPVWGVLSCEVLRGPPDPCLGSSAFGTVG